MAFGLAQLCDPLSLRSEAGGAIVGSPVVGLPTPILLGPTADESRIQEEEEEEQEQEQEEVVVVVVSRK